MSLNKIHIHLGVHKTATTYIQSRLNNSLSLLNSERICYIPLNEFRKDFTSNLHKPNHDFSFCKSIISSYNTHELLVISDENIIGGTNPPKNNKLYPNAHEKIERLLSIFDEKKTDIEFFITLRNYIPYFISRYSEFLRHFSFLDFDDYYADIDFDTISWIELVDELKRFDIKLNIFDFDTIFKNEQTYFQHLLGRLDLNLENADRNPTTLRTKLSNEGYKMVKFFSDNYSPTSSKKLTRLLDNIHQETEKTQFMPFTGDIIENLNIRYNNELEKLQK